MKFIQGGTEESYMFSKTNIKMLTLSLYLSLIVFFYTFYKKFLHKKLELGQTATKLSVLEPQRLKNFWSFISLSYFNFQDTVSDFDKNMLPFPLREKPN